MQRLERFEVGGRSLERGDMVRLAGRRAWLDVYGPMAPDGAKGAHAKYVSVEPSAVKAKVRHVPAPRRVRRRGR
jgi:hypothetical protein